MADRRYGDDEVREIFRLATAERTGNRLVPTDGDGLSLTALQQIAQEAGIDPVRIAQAAASLDARGSQDPVKRMLRMPVALSRVVALPRAATNREWELLVAELRNIVSAPGVATSSGGLREWAYGDLHVCVEPTAEGEQLRLSTSNDTAMGLTVLAGTVGGAGLFISAMVAAAGKPEKALLALGFFGGIALATFGANVWLLPRWARERERQMNTAVEHALRLLAND
jgi:hypothetical protein